MPMILTEVLVSIDAVSGIYYGYPVAALAEIEIIASADVGQGVFVESYGHDPANQRLLHLALRESSSTDELVAFGADANAAGLALLGPIRCSGLWAP